MTKFWISVGVEADMPREEAQLIEETLRQHAADLVSDYYGRSGKMVDVIETDSSVEEVEESNKLAWKQMVAEHDVRVAEAGGTNKPWTES